MENTSNYQYNYSYFHISNRKNEICNKTRMWTLKKTACLGGEEITSISCIVGNVGSSVLGDELTLWTGFLRVLTFWFRSVPTTSGTCAKLPSPSAASEIVLIQYSRDAKINASCRIWSVYKKRVLGFITSHRVNGPMIVCDRWAEVGRGRTLTLWSPPPTLSLSHTDQSESSW